MLAVAERSDAKRKPYLAKLLYKIVLFRLYVMFILFLQHINFTIWAGNEVYPCPVNILTLIILRSTRVLSIYLP